MDRNHKLSPTKKLLCFSSFLIYTLIGCGPMFGFRGKMGPGMMGPWGMGWFGGIFLIVFLIIVLAALAFLWPRIRQYLKNDIADSSGGNSNALEILKDRYARGEIDLAEFEEMKKNLFES